MSSEHGSAAFVNELAQIAHATRYLEIGVARGRTFCDVKIANKVAVDRKFKFDTKSRPGNEHFHEMESNAWFSSCEESDVFDLIFLDGQHTFDQTFRDFCNTLLMAHRETIWLIDDTVPSDFYSAWPDRSEALALRREEGGHLPKSKGAEAWSGDVYKVVFAIHDFFPILSYRTTSSAKKPQTVVWKQTRRDFSPFFDGIESIARSSFFDLRKNIGILNAASEEEILGEIRAHFGRAGIQRNANAEHGQRGAPWPSMTK